MHAASSVAEPSDEPVLLPTRELKVPKPRQTLQFERPWDHFVPAKSVRKLTARPWVSKKFLLRRLSNSSAGGFAFALSSRDQARHDRDDNQHRNRNPNIERSDQARGLLLGYRRRGGLRGTPRSQHPLGVLQPLHGVVVVRL